MSKVFVVTNQHGHFLDKHRDWVDGRDPKVLFRSRHKDEAVNMVFEMSSKDIYLRAEAIAVEPDDKGQPIVEVTTELPPKAAAGADDDDASDTATEGRPAATAEADDAAPESSQAPSQQALATG